MTVKSKNPCEQCLVETMCKKTCPKHINYISTIVGKLRFPGVSKAVVAARARIYNNNVFTLYDKIGDVVVLTIKKGAIVKIQTGVNHPEFWTQWSEKNV